MSGPRKYKVTICTGCVKTFAPGGCTCSGGVTAKQVTAIDERDVEPLVQAAQECLAEGLQGLADADRRAALADALAPFEVDPTDRIGGGP